MAVVPTLHKCNTRPAQIVGRLGWNKAKKSEGRNFRKKLPLINITSQQEDKLVFRSCDCWKRSELCTIKLRKLATGWLQANDQLNGCHRRTYPANARFRRQCSFLFVCFLLAGSTAYEVVGGLRLSCQAAGSGRMAHEMPATRY